MTETKDRTCPWCRQLHDRLRLGDIAICVRCGEQEAVERLLLRLEDDLRAGRFAVVDKILAQTDTERFGPVVLITALAITLPAKQSLRERESFLARVEATLKKSFSDERAAALLAMR